LLEALERHPVPHVFVNREVPGAPANITLDVAAASRLAFEHLTGLGHVRLGHLAGPEGVQSAERRKDAFLAAAAGLPEPPVEHGPFTAAGGAAAGERLLRAHPRLTGVFASSLAQAIGLLHAARAAGRAVPGDLSLIAYDDVPLADYLAPPVTTIAMPLAELAAEGVSILADMLDGAPPRSLTLPIAPQLRLRSSTASAAQR
jgi:LacI family transcriptional regulator